MRQVKFKLHRRFFAPKYTIGTFFIDNVRYSDTLEDTNRDLNKDGKLSGEGEQKLYGLTAIPYGTYKVQLSYSPKFRRVLPEIIDVPHFVGIRIHAGNFPTDTDGCILLGENKIKGGLLSSSKYVDMLVSWMTVETLLGTTFELEIV